MVRRFIRRIFRGLTAKCLLFGAVHANDLAVITTGLHQLDETLRHDVAEHSSLLGKLEEVACGLGIAFERLNPTGLQHRLKTRYRPNLSAIADLNLFIENAIDECADVVDALYLLAAARIAGLALRKPTSLRRLAVADFIVGQGVLLSRAAARTALGRPVDVTQHQFVGHGCSSLLDTITLRPTVRRAPIRCLRK